MKSSVFVLVILLSMSLAAQTASPAAAPVAAADAPALKTKADLVAYLKATRENFQKSIAGLSEAQLKFKAAPDRWSVAEVSEHIALAEGFLGGMIGKQVMGSPKSEKSVAGKEAQIVAGVTDRSKKFPAPDPLKPTGRFATQAEMWKVFNDSRDKNIELVEKTDLEELRSHIMGSPLGDMDGYQWMLYNAGHSARHTKQIEEVKADPNFPKQ